MHDRENRHRSRGRAFALSSLALLLTFAGSARATDPWQLEKRADGIEVYTRAVADSGVKEFKATAEIESSVDDVLALLQESDRYPEWFPDCPESKALGLEGGASYQYSVMAAPWPVSDRDNVFRSLLERDEATGVVEIGMTAAPDHYPEQPDRFRVRHAKGAWRLEPLDERRTRVTFRMHLDPGGDVPKWLINARVVETPFETLTNMRTMIGR